MLLSSGIMKKMPIMTIYRRGEVDEMIAALGDENSKVLFVPRSRSMTVAKAAGCREFL